MDIQKISELVQLIDHTSIAEIEIREGENVVRITRQAPATPAPVITTYTAAPLVPMQAVQETGGAQQQAAPPTVQTPAAMPDEKSSGHAVRSPMVGTVYLAPSPTAKPFVEVGQLVKPGDVLCIVEAMKMMNQIEADKAGTISSRLVENGTPVEFDQPLFIIE
jgi:acetyl-CoA carboxylase biotin carboxyl carrier protein